MAPNVTAVTLALCALAAPASAGAPANALAAANAALAKVEDYSAAIAVHETDGARSQDNTYTILFKRPALERIDVTGGPGKGSGIVYLGGDQVKGHRGGLLSGLHLTFDLHNRQVSSLRGDSIETATFPAMLADFTRIKGEVSEAPGPIIGGSATVAVTLAVDDAAANNGVTREVLYLSDATHLPVRRERFARTALVKSEAISDTQTNIGLTASDFPW